MLERGRQCRDLNPADALESDDVDDGTGVGPVLWKRDPLRMDVRLLPLMSLGKGRLAWASTDSWLMLVRIMDEHAGFWGRVAALHKCPGSGSGV